MSHLAIRQADQGDADAIAELHIRSFLSAYEHLPQTRRSAEKGLERRVVFWKERLGRPETKTLIATAKEHVAGFIHLGPSPDDDADQTTGHIFSVHVDPAQTGSGVGGQLVESALGTLTEDGYRTATLWVLRENERARRFYSRLGWRGDGVTRNESLSVGAEEGDVVEVVRMGLELAAPEGPRE